MFGIWHFIADHFWLITGSLSTLGAVAVVAIIMVCGFPISTIVAAIGSVLTESIKFLETPVGEAIAVLILVLVVGVSVDVHQIRVDDASQRVAVQKALVAQAQKADEDRKARDAYVTQKVGADAQTRIAQIEAEKSDLEKKAKDYETALEASKRARCSVTRDDLSGRLQN
jgi:uncharacterized membrane protein (DUF106 family)